MKQYQVYIRRSLQADGLTTGWLYGDTYTNPEIAWSAMMLARSKGCAAKVITATHAVKGIDMEVVAQ